MSNPAATIVGILERRHIPTGSVTERPLTDEDMRAEFDRNRHRFTSLDRQPPAVLWGAWLANHWTGGDWVYVFHFGRTG